MSEANAPPPRPCATPNCSKQLHPVLDPTGIDQSSGARPAWVFTCPPPPGGCGCTARVPVERRKTPREPLVVEGAAWAEAEPR